MLEDVRLGIVGAVWSGWKSVRIERALDAFAGSFELELTDTFPGAPQRLDIRPGARCVVQATEDVVITGYVDEVAPSYDGRTRTLTVRGRDRTADLVDCIPGDGPGEWRDLTPAGIAADICRPFGIEVVDEATGSRALNQFKRQEGETARETIERAARVRALWPTTDGLGRLVLKTPDALGLHAGRLALGENILAASGTFSTRERFSEYLAHGQNSLEDTIAVDAVVAEVGKAVDAGVVRYRPYAFVSEDLADGLTLEDRAGFEATTRAARARRATYTVAGWRGTAGRIYQPGQTLDVVDPWLGVEGRVRIGRVSLSQTEDNGTVAELEVAGLHAFDLLALKEPTADGGMGW